MEAGVEPDDLEALTALGKRKIVGDGVAAEPREGVGHIVAAAERGGAEALALLSVFFALGMYLRQSWRSSLNSLRLAAERGWEPARAQLRILATDPEPANGGEAFPDRWLKLAASVDLEYWHSAPPAHTLHASPLVRSFPALLEEPVRHWLIDKARGRLTRAQIYDSVSRETTVSETRTNSSAIFDLLDTDVLTLLVQMRMAACAGMPHRHFEAATVLHYAPGQEITPHYDFIDPASPGYQGQVEASGQRVITFLAYLNDDYEGGDTAFVELGLRHRGRAGEGLFFVNALPDGSPDRRTLHAGTPVTGGEKWIVSQFIRNRPAY